MPIVRDKSLGEPLGAGVDKSNDRYNFDITPSDTVRLAGSCDAIYVGGSGNITWKDNIGIQHLYSNALSGTQLIMQGIQFVMATGTTATGLVGIRDSSLR